MTPSSFPPMRPYWPVIHCIMTFSMFHMLLEWTLSMSGLLLMDWTGTVMKANSPSLRYRDSSSLTGGYSCKTCDRLLTDGL